MGKAWLLCGVVTLTGCASVSGLRDKPADVVLNSKHGSMAVGSCIAAGWGEFFGVNVNHAATPGGGYSVNMPSENAGTNGVVDISPSGPGSHVEVRYRLSSLGGYDKFTAVVKRCSA